MAPFPNPRAVSGCGIIETANSVQLIVAGMFDALMLVNILSSIHVLRSVDLWIKGCVKSCAFLLRRRTCFPSPSSRVHAPFYPQIPPLSSSLELRGAAKIQIDRGAQMIVDACVSAVVNIEPGCFFRILDL